MKHSLFFIFLLLIVGRGFQAKATTEFSFLKNPAEEINLFSDDSTKKKTPEKPEEYFLSLTKKVKMGGFIQTRYQHFFDTKAISGFDVRRARLDFKGNITAKAFLRLYLDFANSPKVVDAFGSYTFHPLLKLTAGQFKYTLSYESPDLNPTTLISINRSQVVEALVSRGKDVIGNSNGRDIGAQLSGEYKSKKKYNLVEYYAGIFNGAPFNGTDNNNKKDFSAKLLFQPIKGLVFGGYYYDGAASYGKDLSVIKQRDRWGGELLYSNERISFSAEFIQGLDDTITKQGYYAQLAGFVIKKKLQVLSKYDNYDPDISISKNSVTLSTFGVNYYVTPLTRAMLNYEWRKEEGTELKNDAILLQLQIGF